MGKRKEVVEPVVIPVGKCGEFEVTYRKVAGDEGPAAEFYGLVDGKRVKLLRFDDFEKDPHYHYYPDTPRDKKYSIDPVLREGWVGVPDWVVLLPEMVKAAGEAKLARRITRQKLYDLSEAVGWAMKVLRRQQKQKIKK